MKPENNERNLTDNVLTSSYPSFINRKNIKKLKMQSQNTIKKEILTIYIDDDFKSLVNETSKKLGLSASSFCRMVINEKVLEVQAQ